jgi:hypothetical protein
MPPVLVVINRPFHIIIGALEVFLEDKNKHPGLAKALLKVKKMDSGYKKDKKITIFSPVCSA